MKTGPAFWATVLAALLPASPALAWGPLTHGIVAERVYAQLVPSMPWLAPQRDAFIWGAVGADLNEAPTAEPISRARIHAGATARTLWDEAVKAHDQGARAFALGWAVHMAADEAFDAFDAGLGDDWLAQVAALPLVDGGPAPRGVAKPPAALLGWAVDAALLPRSGDALFDVGRAAALDFDGPTAAVIDAAIHRSLDIEPDMLVNWARLVAESCLQGPDHYLDSRASQLGVIGWMRAAREPGPRQALGDMTPWVTRCVRQGIERVRELAPLPATAVHGKELP